MNIDTKKDTKIKKNEPKSPLRGILEHVGEPLGAMEAPSPKNYGFWGRPGGPHGTPNPQKINIKNQCFLIIFFEMFFIGFGSILGAKIGPK